MGLFVIGVRRAVFGLPFYVTWNLAVSTREQPGTMEKIKLVIFAVPVAIVTTSLWTALWLAAGGLAWRLVNLAL